MNTSHHRLIILLLVSVVYTMIGSSCNTMRGVGRDVESAGNHIQHAAR